MSFMLRLQSVVLKSTAVDLERDLLKPLTLHWVRNVVDSSLAREQIASEVPVDSAEVVEWMHYCASDNAVFEAMAEEYNRLGSQLLSGSGDAYIPGVRVGDLMGESVRGSTVASRGYGVVITPYGNFNVPVGGKATIAVRDLLAWAAIPYYGTIQWTLTLLQWKELAKVPVKKRVRFGSSDGLTAPNFFSVVPKVPVPLLTLRIGLTSDRNQEVVIRGRGVKGSYHQVLFEDKFSVKTGSSEVVYNIYGLPYVSSFTLELAPSDHTQTVLDYIEVFPPVC
jgi:hypothetical protein